MIDLSPDLSKWMYNNKIRIYKHIEFKIYLF